MPDEPLIPTHPLARNNFLGGVFFLALGLVCAYFFMYQPIHDLLHTGQMTYYVKGILLPPLCLYMGALLFTGKFRDGQIYKLNAKGKKTLTRNGWIGFLGAIAVMGLTLAGWFWYLHHLGFESTN